MKHIRGIGYIKFFLTSFLLLAILHFETIYIGPIKVSHLWKGILLGVMLFVVTKTGKLNTRIYTPLIVLSMIQLVNVELINSPINALAASTTTLFLAITGIFVFRYSKEQLEKALIYFSVFFVVCFIPYSLGLLTSVVDGYDLSSFGGTSGLIGPFQRPHTASLTLAASLIVLIYFWLAGAVNKVSFGLIIVFGIYFLFNTYVRTGLAMLLLGLIPITIHFSKKSIWSLLKIFSITAISASLLLAFVTSNEVLTKRIKGISQYGAEDNIESLGSGRGAIYINSLKIYSEATLFEKVLGMGSTEQVARINKEIDAEIGSHNAFLDILLTTGALGLFCFLFYLKKMATFIYSANSIYKPLGKALFVAYLAMSFVQGYERIPVNILLLIIIAIIFKSQKPTKATNV